MLSLIIRMLTTILIGLLLNCKEFLSFIGISYIVDIVYLLALAILQKGKEDV